MPREDGLKAGAATRFSSTNQPANRGRKPSQLKKYLKVYNISKADFDLMFLNVATKKIKEIKEMMKPENQDELPLIVAGFASACIHDVQNGTMTEINKQREFFHGKATQHLDLSTPQRDIPEDPAERRALMETIEREIALTATAPKKETPAIPELPELPKGENDGS